MISTRMWLSLALIAAAGCQCSDTGKPAAPAQAAATVTAEWSPDQIAWRGFDEGLQEAKERQVPVCLVFFTTWCPHCANFSHVFNDPRVIEAAKGLVMVRLDSDKNKEISARYAPDGEYIPRTYFLDGDGNVLPGVKAHEGRFQYFYNEKDPQGVLGGMHAALSKR